MNPKSDSNKNGFNPPYFRSSWEMRLMSYFDMNKNVVRWGSETLIIPYTSTVYIMEGRENTGRRYYVDFYVEMRTPNGIINKIAIEVKPKKERLPPNPPKKKSKKALENYNEAVKTYMTNQDKWRMAEMWCKANGMIFQVMDETNIFGDKKK